MKLHVFNYGTEVGILEGTPDRGILFTYDEAVVSDRSASPLSHSLPLRKEPFTAKECLPFFTGILPDGDLKHKISEYLHVSESSALKLLAALGGECAGTVSLYSADENGDVLSAAELQVNSLYRKLGEGELAGMIERMDQRPLLTSDGDIRLSLAGAQQKISLAQFEGEWFLPLHGSPSTHILKPSRLPFPDLAVNEYACMQAANLCGLPVPETGLIWPGEDPVFVIARYDRSGGSGSSRSIQRVHQEDSCQALGILPDHKYESDGGPGFMDLFSLLNALVSAPVIDIRSLLSLAIYNFLIGNCDAHGKNLAFIRPPAGNANLAPFYDLVSTTVYSDLSTKMSMKIGGEYRIDKIGREHFLKLGDSAGVGSRYMMQLLDSMSDVVSSSFTRLGARADFHRHGRLISRLCSGIEKRSTQIEKI